MTSSSSQVPVDRYLLYVHVPFCERLCPYCSFNRFRTTRARGRLLRTPAQRDADGRELGYGLPAMYVGGGTPTIDIEQLVKTIDLAKSLFSIREISSETNPNHLHPKWVEPLVDRRRPVQRWRAVTRRRAVAADGPVRQVRLGVRHPRASQLHRGRVSSSLNVDMIFNFRARHGTSCEATSSWSSAPAPTR